MISINTARWIDRKIGMPLCRLAAVLRWFRGKRSLPQNPGKILIVKMWGIGTIVLASPVFANLRRQFPEAEIHFLTLHPNRGIYEDSDFIDHTVYLNFTSLLALAASFVKIVAYLRRERFDIIFDFEIGSRFTALLTALSFSSLTVGYVPAGSGKNIFDITIPYSEAVHITQIYLRSLDALQFDIFDRRLQPLPVSAQDRRKVSEVLQEKNCREFVALNPNTSELVSERLWPLENFAALARRLRADFPHLSIVIIGGKADRERSARVRELIGPDSQVFSAAGKFSIRETAALLARAALLVSNDSGPLHLGAAMNIPVIGLFGPETPLHYGPQGEKHTALTAGEICSPCISVYKDKIVDCRKDAVCMKNIDVERVYREAVKTLNRAAHAVNPASPHRETSPKVRHES